MKKIIPLILCFAVIIPCITVVANKAEPEFILNGMESEYYIMLNSVSDDSDAMLLGSLSAKYESNGNPATISEGKDTGGVSYGAYQFASKFDVPLSFANWCVTSGEGVETGRRLLEAYGKDGNTYGDCFNAEWKAIADENPTAFLILQHNYTKTKYYDVMLEKLESKLHGFKIDNYTVALKNVVWSRAVQQGVNSDVIFKAFENLGGFKYQAEDIIIRAIYEQSSLLVDTPPYSDSVAITQASAEKCKIDPAKVVGKYLYYYSRNSSDVQAGVYKRLAINELNDALAMYEKYKKDNPLLPSVPTTQPATEPGTSDTTAPQETTTQPSGGGLIPVPPSETTRPSVPEETTTAPVTQPEEKPGNGTLLGGIGDFFRMIMMAIASAIQMIINLLESAG